MGVVVREAAPERLAVNGVNTAHFAHPHDPTLRTALCGVSILGVPAFEPFEKCIVCERLFDIFEVTGRVPSLERS